MERSELIERIMYKYKLTQQGLAKTIHINKSSISRMISKQTNVSDNMIYRLYYYFNTNSIGYFLKKEIEGIEGK